MRPTSFDPSALRQHLRRNKIADLPELKRVLGTDTDPTVFRKLKQLHYVASYTHRGRFYTLAEIARFDDRGLWSHEGVWFSRYGTLLATLETFVHQSANGYYAHELADALHAEVQQSLRHLIELRYRFQRRHLPIVSVDSKKRELVGNFKNPGRSWDSAPRCVYDHDFRSDAVGVAIPYGDLRCYGKSGPWSLAFPMTLPPLPLMPSLIGGTRKVPLAIPVPASCSFWRILTVATVAAVMPGKPNSSPNWPTPLPWP
jgi:hypothetical protein